MALCCARKIVSVRAAYTIVGPGVTDLSVSFPPSFNYKAKSRPLLNPRGSQKLRSGVVTARGRLSPRRRVREFLCVREPLQPEAAPFQPRDAACRFPGPQSIRHECQLLPRV